MSRGSRHVDCEDGERSDEVPRVTADMLPETTMDTQDSVVRASECRNREKKVG